MIKINLVGDRELSGASDYFQVAVYFLSLSCLVLVMLSATAHVKYQKELLVEEDKLLRAQLQDLKKVTKEVKDLDKKREVLKSKLSIIEDLKKRKVGPVRMLDDLNRALPEKSWISEVRDKDGVLRIDGLALDNQTIADFIKELEKSTYFLRVDLLEARQELWNNVKMKRFSISAKINYTGEVVKKP